MSDEQKQCAYCWEWVKGDLRMAVHIEQAHSDLTPLFSGPTPPTD